LRRERFVRLPILIAAQGAAWEARLVVDFDAADLGISVARRCVDVVELLAVAASGQARVALVAADLRHLDAGAIDRLASAGVVAVGMVGRADTAAEARLSAIGVQYLVPDDAVAKVVAAVIDDAATAEADRITSSGGPAGHVTSRTFGDPAGATSMVVGTALDAVPAPSARGSVIAVWGPAGAPGRTTVAVAVADELARLGRETLLLDADVYGGVVAQVLGLLDESAGVAAACRQASATRMDAPELAGICWQVRPRLRVLTGIPRAQRWTELRPSAIASVLTAARSLVEYTVVDCAFCLESDEELSFDTLAPRRNGATLSVLDAADLVLVVGAADPVGLQRLVRGLGELTDAGIDAPTWIVLNKVRASVVPGDPVVELSESLTRFAGRTAAAFLPYDAGAVDACLATGKTLGETRATSPLRSAVLDLAAAITGTAAPQRGRRRRRR
jgi:MinD-like ATPase involved in chromosome partitioning or flagellar assembly